MVEAVVVSALRTPVATARKGSLKDVPAERLATLAVAASVERAGLAAEDIDDVVLAESHYGGGVLARYAAVAAGLTRAPGQAVNRHCAGSLTAVANAAGSIRSGMDRAVIAGGVQSTSTAPSLSWRPLPGEPPREGMPPTYPYYDGYTDDVTVTVGWNTMREAGLSREEVDGWALRSHRRAIAAIDGGLFADEIVPVSVIGEDGEKAEFGVDEHPRRSSSAEKLASLRPLHPEIEGFGITAGTASGVNDAAAALTLVSDELAAERGLEPLVRVRAWASIGVEPHRMGMAATEVIPVVLKRACVDLSAVDLFEINEAFAPVPLASCRLLGIPEDRVNIYGSGCSIGHPVAASGARMLTTLTHELRRRGGGLGVAAMCAGGGMGGAVVIETL
ncbi:thiolase family protein [Actinomadura sp. B10D3]|uniref:thiolase family protein n=1 Tax=Actinomadura sp. B10D3 TaxID=3153557 RepID=UPI00325D32F8